MGHRVRLVMLAPDLQQLRRSHADFPFIGLSDLAGPTVIHTGFRGPRFGPDGERWMLDRAFLVVPFQARVALMNA